jgi:capsular exopolysaccharide synthesis family protein
MLQPKVYSATASGYVSSTQQSGDAGADGVTNGDNQSAGSTLLKDELARAKIKSYTDIGSWRAVAETVIDDLGLDVKPEHLVSQVSVSSPIDTVIIHVAARASTPEAARDLAESWIRAMAQQIDELEGDGSPGSAAAPLVPGDSARLPTSPSSPNKRLALAIGLLAGLALGIGYALVRQMLDRRVRDPKRVLKETGVSVVGSIPYANEAEDQRKLFTFEGDSQSVTSTAVPEAMRELRTNLQFMDVDNPPRVIVVTSPLPGDGKSTTAANLAVSLAAAGQSTILIDADLRRPMVHEIFGLPSGAGLSDVIAGRVELEEVAHFPDPSKRLAVVSAGFIPPNPAELLGSQRMKDLVARLRESVTVVIDSPPVIPVADAAVLAQASDGVLLVLSAGRTTFDMVEKASENISRVNGHIIGAVLNKVPRRGSSYYGYQYKAGYYAANANINANTAAGGQKRRGSHKAS